MKKFLLLLALTFAALSLISPQKTNAQVWASRSSAKIQLNLPSKGEDQRAKILQGYLKRYDSPLVPYAKEFIRTADKYNLDWKFVVAISGTESTFGRKIPTGSYNGWGWGIYGNNTHNFSSWEDGIETVSKGLRENYINKWDADNIYKIGRMYASSPTWASHVTYFMNQIQDFSFDSPQDALSLSL